jgi:hypothetical protein
VAGDRDRLGRTADELETVAAAVDHADVWVQMTSALAVTRAELGDRKAASELLAMIELLPAETREVWGYFVAVVEMARAALAIGDIDLAPPHEPPARLADRRPRARGGRRDDRGGDRGLGRGGGRLCPCH